MNLLEALVLGIVQGVTEFLPISSTAHLKIVPDIMGWSDPGAAFTAVIQLGTLLAVVLYFRDDILRLLGAVIRDTANLRFASNPDSKLAWLVVLGSIPVVFAGLLLKKHIEGGFRSLQVIAFTQIAMAMLLLAAEIITSVRHESGQTSRDMDELTWWDALLVGLFQAVAIVPGASRSGTTITGGLFAGLNRSTAARFSFLLSLPAVFGAGVYELYKERKELLASDDRILSLVVATIVSGIVGYTSIAFLLNFLKKYSTRIFIAYRIALGVLILVLLWQGVLIEREIVEKG